MIRSHAPEDDLEGQAAEGGRGRGAAECRGAAGAGEHGVQEDDGQGFRGLVRADFPAPLSLGQCLGGGLDRRGHVVAEEGGQAAGMTGDVGEQLAAQRAGFGGLGGGTEQRTEGGGEDRLGIVSGFETGRGRPWRTPGRPRRRRPAARLP